METRTQSWEKLFKKIGLSEYETKIYLSLAVKGPAEARKIGSISGVPRTKVYGTLRKLTERGLVIETLGEPQQYTILSPADSFGSSLQDLKNELSEEVTSIVELENAISILDEIHNRRQLTKPITAQWGDVWFIHGRSETLRRVAEMLSSAKASVDCATTEKGVVLFYKAFNKILDKLAENKVKISIKAPMGAFNKSLIHELRYAFKISNLGVHLPALFVCVDQQELVFAVLSPDSCDLEPDGDLGFFSPNRTLCSFFSSLYGFTKTENPE